MTAIIRLEDVENKIIEIRNQKVLLDSDVAALYGVETRDINKAVKNNPEKFPKGYVFTLTKEEKTEVVEIFHHLEKLKFSPQLPKAFAERGLYMLATILKGSKATQTTLTIIETFARIKQLSRNIKELSEVKDDKNKKNLMQKSGEIIAELLGDDLALNETETTIEINFAVLKFKHTVKKKNDGK
ncbi:MAG: ORF6N domain-containing protein [Bacteroidales bacterium]|nr:ORF6N domain-containing protein [Bacteroidales bacterium]